VLENSRFIQVYTGDGKGKTTAALGLCLRAYGHGFRAVVIQFMKNAGFYGESKLAHLLPYLTVIPFGREGFVNLKNPDDADRELAKAGWNSAKSIILANDADIIVLDEINVAMASGLLDTKDVVSFLKNETYQTEIILTGQNAPDEIIEIAHIVTEMKKIKQNAPHRQGINY
jgi:cob(I)alamin adenosyltransferase